MVTISTCIQILRINGTGSNILADFYTKFHSLPMLAGDVSLCICVSKELAPSSYNESALRYSILDIFNLFVTTVSCRAYGFTLADI